MQPPHVKLRGSPTLKYYEGLLMQHSIKQMSTMNSNSHEAGLILISEMQEPLTQDRVNDIQFEWLLDYSIACQEDGP